MGAPTRTKFPVLPQDEGGKELDTPITVQGRSAIQHGAGDAASISTNTNDYMQLPDNHSALDSGCSTMIVTSLLDTKHCAAGPSNIMQAKDGSVTRAKLVLVKHKMEITIQKALMFMEGSRRSTTPQVQMRRSTRTFVNASTIPCN